MNSKATNIIAVELGILIAILAWLAFSRFPAAIPQTVAEAQEDTADSFATVTPNFESGNQPRHGVDYRADSAPAPPTDAEPAPTPTMQQYDQQIASATYSNSDLAGGFVAGGSPYYDDVDQEPVVSPPAYIVSSVTQIVEYRQPSQIVIISSSRSCVNRPRPTPCSGGRHAVAHRPPPRCPTDRIRAGGGGESRPRVQGIVPHPKINPRSPQPTQGIKVRLDP